MLVTGGITDDNFSVVVGAEVVDAEVVDVKIVVAGVVDVRIVVAEVDVLILIEGKAVVTFGAIVLLTLILVFCGSTVVLDVNVCFSVREFSCAAPKYIKNP